MSTDAERIAQLTAELAEAQTIADVAARTMARDYEARWELIAALKVECVAHEHTRAERDQWKETATSNGRLPPATTELVEELERERDTAIAREQTAQTETAKMAIERDQWKHEAESNTTKLIGEMKQRAIITELRYCIEHLRTAVKREHEGFTKRRRDKDEQWHELVVSRDAAIADRDLWQELSNIVITSDVQVMLRSLLGALGMPAIKHEVTTTVEAHSKELSVTFLDPKTLTSELVSAITDIKTDAASLRACLGATLRWAENDVSHAVAYETALAEMRRVLAGTTGYALDGRVQRMEVALGRLSSPSWNTNMEADMAAGSSSHTTVDEMRAIARAALDTKE